jgi:hypothetical protein
MGFFGGKHDAANINDDAVVAPPANESMDGDLELAVKPSESSEAKRAQSSQSVKSSTGEVPGHLTDQQKKTLRRLRRLTKTMVSQIGPVGPVGDTQCLV